VPRCHRYIHSYWYQFKTVFVRQAALLARNKPFIIAHVFQNIIMGLIVGSLFSGINVYAYQSTLVRAPLVNGKGGVEGLAQGGWHGDLCCVSSPSRLLACSRFACLCVKGGLPVSCFARVPSPCLCSVCVWGGGGRDGSGGWKAIWQ
jgi:hypothetical protein